MIQNEGVKREIKVRWQVLTHKATVLIEEA